MNRLISKAAVAAILGLTGVAQSQVTFEVLGPGQPTSCSADGNWVLIYDGATLSRWSPGAGMEAIEADLGWNGKPTISDDGTRIAATVFDDAGTQTPGVWTEGQGWLVLGPIDGGGVPGEDGSAFGISGDGSTVTGLAWRSDWRARAFSWTEGTGMVNFGATHDDRSSRGSAINGDGSVIGGFDEAPFGNRRAAVWIDGQLTVLEPTSDEWTEVNTVNTAGDVVGGAGGYVDGAKIWTHDGTDWNGANLGFLPPDPGDNESDRDAVALDVSADGSVAVGFNRYGFGPFANYDGFIWNETGMVDVEDWLIDNGIDVGDLDIRGLTALSDDGMTIYGMAYTPGYQERAFRIVIGTPCDADFNADGDVNTLDVLAFLNAWTAGDSAADFNGDGDVNTLDVLAFLNAWTAGC